MSNILLGDKSEKKNCCTYESIVSIFLVYYSAMKYLEYQCSYKNIYLSFIVVNAKHLRLLI